MRTICLIADSQAAALKLGWTRIQDEFPNIGVTFFAGRSTDWSSVAVRGNTLMPGSAHLREQIERSSRGLQEISAGYDAYIVCGLGLGFGQALRLWTSGENADWQSYCDAVTAFVRNTNCAHVLAKLREITAKPIAILSAPFAHTPPPDPPPPLDSATALRLRTTFFDACDALAAAHGAVFAPQPPETIGADGISTLRAFAAPDLQRDRYHCNAHYGALVMTGLLRTTLGN